MIQRMLSLLLALALLCAGAAAFAEEAPVELSIVTVRRTTDITESYSQKVWVQELEEALNVKIEWIELVEGQIDEPLTALLASQDLPDIFWAGSCMTDAIVSQNSSLWHVMTMDEITTYMPNLYNFLETYWGDGWVENQTYPDGNIYSMPGGKMHSRMHVTQGIQYINTQWLDNLGLEMPTTLDEFYEVLCAFRDEDANGNGDPNDEIPFDFVDAFYSSWLMNVAAAWGLPLYPSSNVYYTWDDEGNVVNAVDTEAFRECIEYCYMLGQEGLINLEGFSQTLDQFNANLNADKVGVFWAWGPCNHIEDSELFLQFEPLVPLAAEGYETEMYTGNLDFANAYRNDFIITKDCENIEKAYELWEYASDPIRALEICNGSHRGVMWDFVDENNEFLPADATLEEIAANGFKYLPYVFETEEEENAALTAAGYDWLIGKTYTGSNTTGLVNIAPLMLESENYRTDDLTVWGAQRYVSLDAYDDYLCPYYMNNTIVPPEAQEEFDFMTDGLYNIIKGFFAESVMNGITDESWNAYLNDLETYGYDYYIDFYNKKAHNEL